MGFIFGILSGGFRMLEALGVWDVPPRKAQGPSDLLRVSGKSIPCIPHHADPLQG